MGLSEIQQGVSRGLRGAKDFLGRAYSHTMKFAHGLDQFMGSARGVIGAVAPVLGQMSGPVGQVVGAAIGGGMQGLGAYDRLKTEAMSQANQIGNVSAAVKRGLGNKA